MSYEARRMPLKRAEHQRPGRPEASIDPLQQALAARQASPPRPEARPAPVAPAPVPVADAGKPWAQAFYRAAASAELPLATLNAIVAVCDSHAEAMAKVTARAGGQGPTAPKVAPGDVAAAARIGASHAKAHQPRRPSAQR